MLYKTSDFGLKPGDWKSSLSIGEFSSEIAKETDQYLDTLGSHIMLLRKKAVILKDSTANSLESELGKKGLINLKSHYENKNLKELVLNIIVTEKSIETSKKIIQKYEPAYMRPVSGNGRAQFYAPYKQIGNITIDTFWFNILVLWLLTLISYVILYYNLLQRAIAFFGRMGVTPQEK
jgi:hypothetical protein